MKTMTTKIVALLARLATALLCLPAQAGTVTYFHNDLAGTPLAATDANGNLLWRQGYKPYGERLDPKAPAEQQPWFTGKAHVEAAGLSYFGARWYDPQLGRFMGVDPRGFDEANVHSFNRYAYANNNPYRFVDPDGRQATSVLSPLLPPPVRVGLGFYAGATALGAGSLGSWLTMKALDRIYSEGEAQERKPQSGAGSAGDASTLAGQPRDGEADGPGAGKVFGDRTKDTIRDRDGNKCVFCGKETNREPGPNQSQIDHAWPKSRGGNNSENNGQNTCRTCNLDKGARTTEEYLRD